LFWAAYDNQTDCPYKLFPDEASERPARPVVPVQEIVGRVDARLGPLQFIAQYGHS